MNQECRLNKQSRILVCFMGVDGSGKTTQAQRMYGLLSNRGRKVHYLHHSFSLLNYFKSGEKIKGFASHTSKVTHNKFLSILFCLGAVVNGWVSYIKYALPLKGTIFYDRYYYDQLVPYVGDVPRWFAKLCIRLVKKPFVVYYMCPPLWLCQQRDKNTKEFYEYQSGLLEKFFEISPYQPIRWTGL